LATYNFTTAKFTAWPIESITVTCTWQSVGLLHEILLIASKRTHKSPPEKQLRVIIFFMQL